MTELRLHTLAGDNRANRWKRLQTTNLYTFKEYTKCYPSKFEQAVVPDFKWNFISNRFFHSPLKRDSALRPVDWDCMVVDGGTTLVEVAVLAVQKNKQTAFLFHYNDAHNL